MHRVLFRMARASEQVPWQASAAAAWGTLFSIHMLSDVWERECPTAAAAHSTSRLALGQEQLDRLRLDGYIVVDGCLSTPELEAARAECRSMKRNGAFDPTDQHAAAVRTDRVAWVREGYGGPGAQPEAGVLAALRALRSVAHLLEGGSGGAGWVGFTEPQLLPPQADVGTLRTAAPPATAPSLVRLEPTAPRALGVPLSCQLACYSPRAEADEEAQASGGARYVPHRDGFASLPLSSRAILLPSVAAREVTAILYLTDTEAWLAAGGAAGGAGGGVGGDVGGGGVEPGGSGGGSGDTCAILPGGGDNGDLVLFLGACSSDTTGATASRVVRIAPLGGRLVLFDARRVLHEVRPHNRVHVGTGAPVDRLALTVWVGGAHSVAGFVRATYGTYAAAAAARVDGWAVYSQPGPSVQWLS